MLVNLIKHKRPSVDKIYFYFKDPFESKQLINKRKRVGIKNEKNPKAFIDYSQTTHNFYEKLEDYNPANKRIMLIVFDNMIAGHKKLSPVVTELFMWEKRFQLFLYHNIVSKGLKI